MNRSREELLLTISNCDEVKHYQKLQKLVNAEPKYQERLNQMREVEKQMVNAKHLQLINAYLQFKKEYELILSELEQDVLLQEYLTAKSEVDNLIKTLIQLIEDDLSQVINE